jgi:hypothetical protein
MLLPFASFPIVGSIDGLSADAWPALLPLVVLLLITLTSPWDLGFDPLVGIAAVAMGAASLAFSLVKVTDAIVAVRDTADATLGPGVWVLTAAVVVATGGAAYGVMTQTRLRR